MRKEKTESLISVNKKFGENLSKLRKQQNLSIKEIADKLNLTTNTIRYYEQGERTPNLETLLKMAEMLNVSTDELLSNTHRLNDFAKYEVLNYRLKQNLYLANLIGMKQITADKEGEIKFSFPITPQIERLPNNEGIVKPLKAQHLTFSDAEYFCDLFESWLQESVAKKTPLLDVLSDFIRAGYYADFETAAHEENTVYKTEMKDVAQN